MKAFEWTAAQSVEQALGQLGRGAVLKAGGLDLLDLMKEGLAGPRRLVDIRAIPGLDGVVDDPVRGLTLGPLVTLARLAADPAVRGRYTALADAAGEAATPQIRNVATLGGNLLQRPRCWYFRSADFHCRKKGGERCFAHDGENRYHAIFANQVCAIVHPSATATALVAMGARLELAGAAGRREAALEELLTPPEVDVQRENALAPGEMITAVRLPAPAAGARSVYLKQGEKASFDWPLADVAVVLERDGGVCRRAAIVLGAAAPVPWRARAAEAALAGRALDGAAAREAARAALAGARPLAGNEHKLPIFEALVRRAVLATAARSGDGP